MPREGINRKLGVLDFATLEEICNCFSLPYDAKQVVFLFARFVSKHGFVLSNSLTSAGLLYETDLQLRPDGNSGLLVSDVAAFRDYQLHKAWVWEHQALTRARFVAGDAKIGAAFESIKAQVIAQPRDIPTLKTEVLNMRQKMRHAQPDSKGEFDLKHSLGGIIDVEFLVQYLVLKHAVEHPELTKNIGNIALLKMLGSLDIIDLDLAEKAASAYREYRHMQHMLKLQGITNNRVANILVEDHAKNVMALWQEVLL